MANVTLEQINRNIIDLKKEIEEIKEYMKEDFELTDEVKKEIEDSRKKNSSEFVKHSEVMKRIK